MKFRLTINEDGYRLAIDAETQEETAILELFTAGGSTTVRASQATTPGYYDLPASLLLTFELTPKDAP